MAASALITFDTSAPVLSIGVPRRVDAHSVEIPIDADEPYFLDAEVQVLGYGVVPSQENDEGLLVSGLPAGSVILHVDAVASDDVDNQAVYMAEYPVVVFEMMARLIVQPSIRGVQSVTGSLAAVARHHPVVRGKQLVRRAVDATRAHIRKED